MPLRNDIHLEREAQMRTIIKVDGTELTPSSINISETGIAIQSFTPFNIGAKVQLRLDLPGVAESLKSIRRGALE